MKKAFLVIFLLCFAVFDSAGQKRTIFSDYTACAVEVDGLESEEEWLTTDSIAFSGIGCGSRNKVVVKTLWDEEALYLLFKVSDENLQAHQTEQDHPKLFLDDMVEFLIDMNHDRDSCWNEHKLIYHINLLGTKKDDKGTVDCLSDPAWNGSAVYAVKLFGTLNDSQDVDEGYQVEAAIPWPELQCVPEKGLILGVNFANGDNDNNGRALFDWLGIFPFRSPHLFGDLVLR